jgi:hypothetical protein
MQWSRQMIESISNKQDASNKAKKTRKENKSRIPGIKDLSPATTPKFLEVIGL